MSTNSMLSAPGLSHADCPCFDSAESCVDPLLSLDARRGTLPDANDLRLSVDNYRAPAQPPVTPGSSEPAAAGRPPLSRSQPALHSQAPTSSNEAAPHTPAPAHHSVSTFAAASPDDALSAPPSGAAASGSTSKNGQAWFSKGWLSSDLDALQGFGEQSPPESALRTLPRVDTSRLRLFPNTPEGHFAEITCAPLDCCDALCGASESEPMFG